MFPPQWVYSDQSGSISDHVHYKLLNWWSENYLIKRKGEKKTVIK